MKGLFVIRLEKIMKKLNSIPIVLLPPADLHVTEWLKFFLWPEATEWECRRGRIA
jgi:hypothetical protein